MSALSEPEADPVSPPAAAARVWKRALLAALCAIVVADSIAYAYKLSQGRSAFLRWQPQIVELADGVNIHRAHAYPNPPIMALLLFPLASLPPTVGAMLFYFIKVALAGISAVWALRLAAAWNRPRTVVVAAAALALTLRPLLEDLQHGNVNIVVGWVVLGSLYAFRCGRDALSGIALGLAISMKVTPGLFVLYFLYKRKWRVAAWSVVGVVLFLALVPSALLGAQLNAESLSAWFDGMIRPYALDGVVAATSQLNQSLPGIAHRLLTDVPGLRMHGTERAVNWVSLDPASIRVIVRAFGLGVLAWLAWVCRGAVADRSDRRYACEFSLVMIATLLLSERSWKAHFVVMLLPYATIAAHLWIREATPDLDRFDRILRATLIAAFVLMLSTARDISGWLYWSAGERVAHKYAEAYGMFGLSAIAMFIAVSALREALRKPAAAALE